VTLRLQQNGIETIPVGISSGRIGALPIGNLKERPHYQDIHTLTMYLNQYNQRSWYEYMLKLQPQRVIFNPGSENPEFYQMLNNEGIIYQEACTLVMLASGIYKVA
jgi:predicted CoA-binding protein